MKSPPANLRSKTRRSESPCLRVRTGLSAPSQTTLSGNAQGLDGGSEARGGDAGDAFLERVEGDGVFGGGEELARAGDLDAAAVLRVRALEIEVQEGKSAVGQNACVDVLAVLRHDERTQHALRADVGDGLRVDDFKACEQGGEGLACVRSGCGA